jgi:hypothetical protein
VNVETEYTEFSAVNVGVHRGSVLVPQLHLLYTSNLSNSTESTTAAFPDDTVILATNSDSGIALQELQAIQGSKFSPINKRANKLKLTGHIF